MQVDRLVGRTFKPRHVSEYDVDEEGVSEADAEDLISGYAVDPDKSADDRSLNEDADNRNDDRSATDDSEGADVGHEISNVSFGALLQAQDALARKRKRGSDTTAEQEVKLEGIRARLREIRSNQNEAVPGERGAGPKGVARSLAAKQPNDSSVPANTSTGNDTSREDDELDWDSAPSEEGMPLKSRSSKHAPATQSSKRQVTRKRTVIGVPKRVSRDPRFDALQQHSAHPGNSEKAYSFLLDYQKDEIAELKAAIKQTHNEDDKETLKRKLISMENRVKSKEAKEREQEVLRRHRKEERDKVEQGKKPFFLKQKELKERAEAEKFKGMKKKDQEKLMQKRRRKEDQKEKKRMPEARRVAG